MSVFGRKCASIHAPAAAERRQTMEDCERHHAQEWFCPSRADETLHTVQSSFGYLDDDAIRFVALTLRVPLSQAYGVVTFYHYFSLKPPGKHTMTICQGTACY